MKVFLAVLFASAVSASATDVTLERVPESGIQPQAVVTDDGAVHLVYLTGKPEAADIRYVTRGSGSASWSAPVTVNSEAHSAVAAGTIRGAQLAAGRAGILHAVWNGAARGGDHAAAPLWYARLQHGKFSPQRALHKGTIHLDGGASVAADAKGRVFVVWHAAQPGRESERERRIFVCSSKDGGETFNEPAPAAGSPPGVCACCSLKAAVGPDGVLRVLYRNASTSTQRDMTLLESADGAETFTVRVLDPWPIAACPMSSAGLASCGKETCAVWETAGAIRLATLARNFQPLDLAAKDARHPALAANFRGETLVTWSIGTGWKKGGSFGWVLMDSQGQPTSRRGTAQEVPVWGYTAAFATKDGDFVILY